MTEVDQLTVHKALIRGLAFDHGHHLFGLILLEPLLSVIRAVLAKR